MTWPAAMRVVVGGSAAGIKKFKTGLHPWENRQTALRALEKRPPLVPYGTTFAPVGSVSLDSQSPKGSLRIQFPCHPAKAGALWVLSIVPHDTKVSVERFILPPE